MKKKWIVELLSPRAGYREIETRVELFSRTNAHKLAARFAAIEGFASITDPATGYSTTVENSNPRFPASIRWGDL